MILVRVVVVCWVRCVRAGAGAGAEGDDGDGDGMRRERAGVTVLEGDCGGGSWRS